MLQDLAHAWRSLTRRPLFLAVAILTLAVGIGLNTALFSIANVMLLKPLPVREGGALVWIASSSTTPDGPQGNMTYPDVVDLGSVEGLEGAAAYGAFSVNVAAANQAARLGAQAVTGNFFELLGMTAHRGRLLQPYDDRQSSEPVAVISYAAWQRLFGGRNDAIGQVVRVNGQPFALVGVAPRLFHGVHVLETADFWVPIAHSATVSRGVDRPLERTSWWLKAFGRLSPGADRTAVTSALRARAGAIAQAFPESHDGFTVAVDPLRGAPPDERPKIVPLFALLLAVTMIVLLIACANVANLLVVRGMAKGRETAIRAALGASRWRLLRYEMIETAIITLAGGACGLLLSLWATEALLAFAGVALDTDLSPDWRVLVFTFAVSACAALAFGLMPALRSSSRAAAPALKSEQASADARPRARVQTLLVAGQLALSMVLLTAAALFVKSLVAASSVDVGFDPAGRVSMFFNLRMQGYTDERANAFHRSLLDRVRAQPGVRATSLARRVPLGGVVDIGAVSFPDQPVDPDAQPPRAALNHVWPGFFETMGILLVRGRDFTDADLNSNPSTAIVNQAFVRKHWPERDPIGQRFSFSGARGPFLEVVGVARDAIVDELTEAPMPLAYLPGVAADDDVALLAWIDGESGAALRSLEAQVRGLDGGVAVFAPKTLAAHIADRMDSERALSRILSATGLVALMLAAIGLYGVIAYTVVRRRREIGVRIALGARPGDVVRLFVLDAGRLALIGLSCGLPLALGVNAFLAGNLVGVRVADPAAIGAVVIVLMTASLLAAYLPARRAAGVDPIIALRTE